MQELGSINVAIIGVGNCASSLVQGVSKYADATNNEEIPGLMHPVLGEYGVGDINFVAAFDVDASKVGLDLSEAIYAKPNNTVKFQDVEHTGITVQRGMTHDGVGKYMSDIISKADGPTDDITGILKEREVDVVINYLPVGSEQATKWYVEQVLAAGVRVHQLHTGVHSERRGRLLAAALPRGERTDNRGRHQVAGGRDDCASRAGAAVYGQGRAPG